MKFLAMFVLGWALVPMPALAQEKVELNTITGVKVNGNTVEITGTKKPNFSSFTMTDPPRLVIDISEAVLKDVPGETRVNKGLITGLRSANYGSDSSAIARVLIGYDRDVETDIQVNGSVLLVKVLEGGAPLVAQAMPGPEQPVQAASGSTGAEAQAGTTQGTSAAQPEQTDQGKSAAEAARLAQADREAQEKQKAEAAAAAAKQAEEDRRKQEEAARAEAARKAEDEKKAQQLAAAEEKKRQQEQALAEAEAKKKAEAEEHKRKEEEARLAAEAKRQEEADEKKRKAEEAEQKRLAALEEKKRQQQAARDAAEAKRQEEAEEKKRRAEEAEQKRVAALEEKKRQQQAARDAAETQRQQEAEEKKRRAEEVEQKRLAMLEEKKHQREAEPPRRVEPESPSPGPVSSRHKVLELVGFQQQAAGSRVYVRTNEPVSYKVSEGRNEIVLMLENTQIGRGNNTRALDTSFFDSAVAYVDPTVGPDRTVRVSIKLKEAVPVQTRQEGNTISLEFPRPPR